MLIFIGYSLLLEKINKRPPEIALNGVALDPFTTKTNGE